MADSTSPQLKNVDIDMDGATTTLTFDETVDVSTLLRGAVTLLGNRSGSPAVTFSACPDGTCSLSKDGTVVKINILDDDMNQIKLKLFATEASNAFVSITDALVKDAAQVPNKVKQVLAKDAIKVSGYTKDGTDPRFASFKVDLEDSVITMTFTEPVKPASINYTGIVLQASSSSRAESLRLTGGSVAETALASMTITINVFDSGGQRNCADLQDTGSGN